MDFNVGCDVTYCMQSIDILIGDYDIEGIFHGEDQLCTIEGIQSKVIAQVRCCINNTQISSRETCLGYTYNPVDGG